MYSLDRRLVELNEALLKLHTVKGTVDQRLIDQAIQALSGAGINTGTGNDTVIINNPQQPCNTEPGPPGPPGPPGNCCQLVTRTVTENYQALDSDCYLGVICEDEITITLPESPENGKTITIKLEMGPPIGNRKVTVEANDATIDGKDNIKLQIHYESVTLIFSNDNWFTI